MPSVRRRLISSSPPFLASSQVRNQLEERVADLGKLDRLIREWGDG